MPLVSAAERRIARFTVLLIEPSERPSAPPVPVPTVAGRFTAKFGFGDRARGGERPAVGVVASDAAADEADEDGNAAPVGLPVAG